jgi:hypothetical protein
LTITVQNKKAKIIDVGRRCYSRQLEKSKEKMKVEFPMDKS